VEVTDMAMAMTTKQMVAKLRGVGHGSILFVSYEAGRSPTERAKLEAGHAARVGCNRRHFVGSFEGLTVTQTGETVLTIKAYNRDKVTGRGMVEGAYRTFNPNLGRLLSLEVIELRRRAMTPLQAAKETWRMGVPIFPRERF
jgi:hypothetical protein